MVSVPVYVNGEFLWCCKDYGRAARLCVYLPDGAMLVNRKGEIVTVEARYQEVVVAGTCRGMYVLNDPLLAGVDGKVILDVDLDLSRNPYRP